MGIKDLFTEEFTLLLLTDYFKDTTGKFLRSQDTLHRNVG